MKKAAWISLLVLGACMAPKNNTLCNEIAGIASSSQGILGLSFEQLESGDTMSFNGSYHCPMQSVFKFPIALAIMDKVDKGTLSLTQKVHIDKTWLADTTTWSPLRDEIEGTDTDVSIEVLLRYVTIQSDNIACDLLLEKAGGPSGVENFIHSLGIKGFAIAGSEKQMHADGQLQYKSYCEPLEMTRLLRLFYENKCVSKPATDTLMRFMQQCATATHRIKGLLPEGTIVAHKSGSSGSANGLAPATNDVGIITLPNNQHLIISVFLTDSRANDSIRDAVIAQTGKAAYDYYKGK